MSHPNRTHPVFRDDATDAYVAAERLGVTDADIAHADAHTAEFDDLVLVDTDRAEEVHWDVSRPTTDDRLFFGHYLGFMPEVELKNVALMVMASDGSFWRLATLSKDDVLHLADRAVRRSIEAGRASAACALKVLQRYSHENIARRRLLDAAAAAATLAAATARLEGARTRLGDADEIIARGHLLPSDVTADAIRNATDEWYMRAVYSASKLYPRGTALNAALYRMSGKAEQFDAAHEQFWARTKMRYGVVLGLWNAMPAAVGDNPASAAHYCTDPLGFAQTPGVEADLIARDEQRHEYVQHVLSLADASDDSITASHATGDQCAATVLRLFRLGVPGRDVAAHLRHLEPVWKQALLLAIGSDAAMQKQLVDALSALAANAT